MIPAWLFFGPEPYLATCGRCGDHVDKPPLPMEMKAFVRLLNQAGRAHMHCEEKK